MNQAQRKQLAGLLAAVQQIADALTHVDSQGQDLDDIAQAVDELATEEQDKFDNLSEGLQQSERGQALEEAANTLNELKESIDEANQMFADLRDKLEEIAGTDLP